MTPRRGVLAWDHSGRLTRDFVTKRGNRQALAAPVGTNEVPETLGVRWRCNERGQLASGECHPKLPHARRLRPLRRGQVGGGAGSPPATPPSTATRRTRLPAHTPGADPTKRPDPHPPHAPP